MEKVLICKLAALILDRDEAVQDNHQESLFVLDWTESFGLFRLHTPRLARLSASI